MNHPELVHDLELLPCAIRDGMLYIPHADGNWVSAAKLQPFSLAIIKCWREEQSLAAPVAQAAAGRPKFASKDGRLERAIQAAIYALDHAHAHATEPEDRVLYGSAGMLLEMLNAPRPEADADRASGGAVEALRELLWAIQTEIPPFEAGHEAQEAWSTRRLAARNNAAAILRATPTTKD